MLTAEGSAGQQAPAVSHPLLSQLQGLLPVLQALGDGSPACHLLPPVCLQQPNTVAVLILPPSHSE